MSTQYKKKVTQKVSYCCMTGVPLCTINAYFITYYQELKVQYYFMQVKYELLDLNELKFVALHQIILLQIIYTSIN